MGLNRRSFLKKSAFAAAGTIAASPFMQGETIARPSYPESKPSPHNWSDEDINVAWIGHATVLINFFGTIIITDPVLFGTVGLYFLGITFGPHRYTFPALEIEEIPKPDLILLSHAHMDHMDMKTLVNFTDLYPGQIDCITAYNTMDVIEDLKWKSLKEIDWNQETNLHGINFRAIEVQHFGWRYPWEKDRSKGFMKDGRSFNAYLLEKQGKKILFGGDTAYSEKFLESGVKDIDVAIMPIGAYNPWRRNHCNPEEALMMASEHLNAKHFVPIHCNTFPQGQEPREEPLQWLSNSKGKYNMNVGVLNIGQTLSLTGGVEPA